MSVITSGSFAKALLPGVKKWHGEAYNEKAKLWPMIFERDMSTRAYEELVQVSGFGLFAAKNEGDAITYDSRSQGFVTRLTHVTYASGFIVTEEAIEDDQYDVVARQRARALGRSGRVTEETIAGNVLNRAFNSSYTGADGKELLATDHPNYSGGTFSNELATAADLSEASLEDLCIQIEQATDDRGLRIGLMPKSLIVAPANRFEAMRILKSVGQNDTANNAINALKASGLFSSDPIINPYLTDDDAWFVKTDCPDGLIGLMRREMSFGVDNDFDTSNAKFKATFRASWGWADPKGVYGSPGA